MEDKLEITKAKFYKDTFENIPEYRRQRVLDVAILEFASNGYNAANINTIAKKADISIGSLYSYFDSKEALFLTIVDIGFHLLETALSSIDSENDDIFDVFDKLLRISKDYAIKYPEMNQIYLDLTTQGLSSLSEKLSWKMESTTAKLYQNVIKKSKQKGLLGSNIDEKLISFYLDNLIIMFQFSFTSDYYKERMKIFIGQEAVSDSETIIKGLLDFVRKALSA